MHKIMVTSDGVREKECKKLHEYTQRMYKNIYYYEKNAVIKTTFSFLKLVVDSWYPIAYNNSTEKKVIVILLLRSGIVMRNCYGAALFL